MQSLSSYDKGRRAFEGRRYTKDIAAGNHGMDLFMEPIYAEKERCMQDGVEWDPTFDFAMGNHEERILRATDIQPELDGLIGYKDFNLVKHGWTVHQYLEVFQLDGVSFAHYFASGVMNRSITSARALLTKQFCSCVQGHVQKRDIAVDYTADGRTITGLMLGSFYQHRENYLGPQVNAKTWHGLHYAYNVRDGEFSANAVDLAYLRDRFSGK